MLIDSHCHLEFKDFANSDDSDGRPELLSRARQAGVGRFICVGSGGSLDEVRTALSQAELHDDIFAAIGIHPHDAARATPEIMAEIERLAASHPRMVAVGETGLDYHYDHSPRDVQQALFRDFLGIARRTGKPVSLHLRESTPREKGDAHADAQRILAEENIADLGGVVHCFTGNRADAERYLALGLHISFSGVVTFKSAGSIREAAAIVPLERILVETDCPYMAPVPMRGKRNEPAYVTHTARFLADLLGVPFDAFAQATSANATRLFRLAAPPLA